MKSISQIYNQKESLVIMKIRMKRFIKISEIKDISIFQIVKFKNSKIDNKIEIDNLSLPSSLKFIKF